MHKIARIVAREILDSRGNPTVEAEVFTDTGAVNEQSLHSFRCITPVARLGSFGLANRGMT